MQDDEIFTATPPSNGRAVQRSTNAGVELHRHDQRHAVAAARDAPGPARHRLSRVTETIAFLGSDGGVVRTSGLFADASADCDSRGTRRRGPHALQGVAVADPDR